MAHHPKRKIKIAIKKHKRIKESLTCLPFSGRWNWQTLGLCTGVDPSALSLPLPHHPFSPSFPVCDSRCCFLDSGPGRPCFGWWVVLCWHLRQEFPGKIVKRFFWCHWQGSKRFRVPLSRQMGRENGRDGEKQKDFIEWLCFIRSLYKKAERWLDDNAFLSPYPLPSFYESSEFGLGVLKAAQTSTVRSQFSQK